MTNDEVLEAIADHMHAFNLGVGADDHEALVAQIATTLLDCTTTDQWGARTCEHVEALAERRPPGNWACI